MNNNGYYVSHRGECPRHGAYHVDARDELIAPCGYNNHYSSEFQDFGIGDGAPADPLVTATLNPSAIFNATYTQEMSRFSGTPNQATGFGTTPPHGHSETSNFNPSYTPLPGRGEIHNQQISLPTSGFKETSLNIPNNGANIYHRSNYIPTEGMVHTGIGNDTARGGAALSETRYRKGLNTGFEGLENSVTNSQRVLLELCQYLPLALKTSNEKASRPKLLISAAELLDYLTSKVQQQEQAIWELRMQAGRQIPSTTFDWRAEPG